MTAPPKFEVRNVHFAFDEDIPRHWHGGRASTTAFLDNLSVFFPEGESFFVRSVRAFRHLAEDDPELRRAVRDFCGQEGIHSREHRAYNDMVAAKGYPVGELDRKVGRLLNFVRRRTPRRFQLAATAALEHFTALMAHAILSDDRVLEDAHPVMRDLWLWHAAEENEHKAVAYDLYVLAGGNYPERVLVMIAATVIFWAKVLEHQIRFMRVDGIASSPAAWGELLGFLYVAPGPLRRIIPHYLSWYLPGFHPWDLDNRELLEAWKTHFEVAATHT